mgnify:CR=1 FL=1
MDESPDVLTIGFRCQKHGYGFHWGPYSDRPYFVTPEGEVATLTADIYCPYYMMAMIKGASYANEYPATPGPVAVPRFSGAATSLNDIGAAEAAAKAADEAT